MLCAHRTTLSMSSCLLLLVTAVSGQVYARQQPPLPDGWEFTVGLGVQSKPNYVGDDDQQVVLLPSVSATYGQHWAFSFNKGIQYTVNPHESLQWGLALTPALGRDSDGENSLRISGDGTTDLIGLDDIDSAGALRIFTKYSHNGWTLDLEAQQAFRDDSENTISLGIQRLVELETKGPPIFLSGGLTVKAGDENALTSLVGVSDEESALSNLAPYSPESGVISVGFRGTIIVPLSKSLRVLSILSVDQLGSNLEDSSLITERGDSMQTSLTFFLSYKLGAK